MPAEDTAHFDIVIPVLSGHSISKEDPEIYIFKTDNRLMQVKSIAECSGGASAIL